MSAAFPRGLQFFGLGLDEWRGDLVGRRASSVSPNYRFLSTNVNVDLSDKSSPELARWVYCKRNRGAWRPKSEDAKEKGKQESWVFLVFIPLLETACVSSASGCCPALVDFRDESGPRRGFFFFEYEATAELE